MREKVQIVAIQKNQLIVTTIQATSCAGCATSCGQSIVQQWLARHSRRIAIPVADSTLFDIGQIVEVTFPSHALLSGALWVYVLPLVAALIMAIASPVLVQWPESEMIAIAGGGVGFIMATAIVRYWCANPMNGHENWEVQQVAVDTPEK